MTTDQATGTINGYLFYKSKEQLLFDVLLEQHELINQKLYQQIVSRYLLFCPVLFVPAIFSCQGAEMQHQLRPEVH